MLSIKSSSNSILIGLVLEKEKINNITVYWLEKDSKFRWLSQKKYLITLKNIKPNYVFLRLSSNLTYICAKYSQKYNAKFHWICTGNLCVYKTLHIRSFFRKVSIKNTFILKFLDFFWTKVCVASTCSTSEVPIPNAKAPNAPCVAV